MSATPHRLPDLPASLRWLDRPPLGSFRGLRGHVVVLLLWRLGCVHSRLALAALAALQRDFAGRAFAALAVHTPIEAAELDEARLRRHLAALPLPITAAVDAQRLLLGAFAGRALPWLVVAEVDGTVAFCGRGEPARGRLVDAIETLLRRAEREGRAAPATFAPVPAPVPAPQPGGLAADGGTLWVAAPGHRRVFQVDREGRVLRAIGSGSAGAADGAAEVASFVLPAGLCLRLGHVVVADAGSHTLRAIDRVTGNVATWCGDGRRSTDRHGGGFGDQQGLCAPVAPCAHAGFLCFAQAGAHQLWRFDPETLAAGSWLGSGARALRDGAEPAFAEPLGLGAGQDELYVADAANGALRRIDLGGPEVRTVATGIARPAAVAVRGREVFVAAAWQPAVLRWRDGEPPEVLFDAAHGLVEPNGLTFVDGELWIADAGAGCLFAGVPQRGGALRRVDLSAVPALPPRNVGLPAAALAEPITVAAHADATLSIDLPCGPGEAVDAGAPCSVDVADDGDGLLAGDRHAAAMVERTAAVLALPVDGPGQGTLRVRVQATVRGADGTPRARTWHFLVPATVAAGAAAVASIGQRTQRTEPSSPSSVNAATRPGASEP